MAADERNLSRCNIFGRYILNMIFITLGSQKFQFNRLLKKVDELIGEGVVKDDVFAQIGASDYKPKNYAYKEFLSREEFVEKTNLCDLIITHGGTGAIIGAIKKGKKVIAIPRLEKYGEHVDDHQLQLLDQFRQLNLIWACKDCEELEYALKEIKNKEFNEYQSNTQTIVNSIERFINIYI